MLDCSFKDEHVNLVDKSRLSNVVICRPSQQLICFKIVPSSYRAYFWDEGSLESQFKFSDSIAPTLPSSWCYSIKSKNPHSPLLSVQMSHSPARQGS